MFFNFLKKRKKECVFVGLSGGVDSSVAASLLQGEGYNVVGVFIRTWQPDWIPCSQNADRESAMRVCAHLQIPFLECDAEEIYKREIVDEMLAQYQLGNTPNPDILCNQHVKFGAFLDFALRNGADRIATGHYARNIFNPSTSKYELYRGIDHKKDQSYFLSRITQDQLARTLFPLGALQKSDVRQIAARRGLHTASRRDSQGICFLGEVDMREFLLHYFPKNPGKVINQVGDEIGRHDGAIFYTLGERHGFTITRKTDHDKPLYIVAKDVDQNILTVAPAVPQNHGRTKYRLVNVHRISDDRDVPDGLLAQTRYHGPKNSVALHKDIVQFDEPQLIASGQFIVFYVGEQCIMSGIVAEI